MQSNDATLGQCHRRIELRTAVLHYGGLLGWPTPQVISFTEALTGCAWRHCGTPQFLAVLDEYLAILDAIAARQRRPKRKGEDHALRS
ncbi:MAG: hypothetical protein U0822_17035 [Anaerolineae bacterium]